MLADVADAAADRCVYAAYGAAELPDVAFAALCP